MNRTLKMKLRKISRKDFILLKDLCSASKDLYNQSLWEIRDHYKKTGKHLSYGEVDKLIKTIRNLEGEINYRKLKAGVSQQILRKLDESYKSFFRAVKDYKKNKHKYNSAPRPPKYIKEKYHNLIFDNQRFIIKEDKPLVAVLDKPKDLEILIPKQLMDKVIVQIEIIPKYNYFEAAFIYKDFSDYKQISKNDNVIGIDLGLNNLATIASNGCIKPFIISGKPLKSVNQFYNKNLAKFKSRLDKEGENKWSNRLQRLTDIRNNKINDYLHKASKIIVDECVKNKVSLVVVGNVTKSNNKINLGKKTNQNFVNLPLGQFVDKLKYKLEVHNITVKVVDESYTSKASFIDNDFLPDKYGSDVKYSFSGRRIKRGLYRTRDNVLINADLNGAFNIIRKVAPNFKFSDLDDRVAGWFLPYIKSVDTSMLVNID